MDDETKPTWKRGEPCLQPYYSFENGAWNPISSSAASSVHAGSLPSQFRLISWNIDAMVRFGPVRMGRALEHLGELYLESINSKAGPLIIFLQEMTLSDLKVIQGTAWVREHFYITDRTRLYCEGDARGYGTTTLIDKRAVVVRVFRVHYEKTRMQRDGLFVDIAIEPEVSKAGKQQHHAADTQDQPDSTNPKILRLCNTHLESLLSNPPIRPTQMKTASKFLHPPAAEGEPSATLPTPHASILAGDLNAFAPEDQVIVSENNLEDTYLAVGGQEGAKEGHTWGMHRPTWKRARPPNGRLDKVLYCGGAKPEKLEKIGAGLKVDVAKSWAADRRANGEVGSDSDDEPFEKWEWVTDHLGLMADFTLI